MSVMGSLAELIRDYRNAPSLQAKGAAAAAIVSEIHPSMWIFVRSRVGTNADAEDLVQEVLKGFFTGLPILRGDSSEQAWGYCYRIAFNRLGTFYKRKGRNLEDCGLDDSFWRWVEDTVASVPADSGKYQDLHEALAILKESRPNCIRYFEMYFYQGMTYVEMGPLIGKNADATRKQVERCLEQLKHLLPKKV